MRFDSTHLASVPYLRPVSDGRVVPIQSFWDGEAWQMWIPDPRGGLLTMRPVDCAAGLYVAKSPARDTDLHIPFVDFMWKHASWPEITRWLVAIENGIVKLAASMAKIEHFDRCESIAQRHETDVFIATEIEYLFGRCRSLFDDLQHVVAALWENIQLLDEADARRKRKLPDDSFRKVAQRIRDRKQGELSPYGMPEVLVQAYATVNDFFFSLRSLRDKLLHRGGEVGRIFATDRGYAVEHRGPLAKMVPQSVPPQAYNDNLVALGPSLAHVVCSSIYALNAFSDAFQRVIKFPESLIPEHALFLRTPHAPALVSAQKVLRGESAWRPGPGSEPAATPG